MKYSVEVCILKGKDFINKANIKYNNKFDYSKVVFKNVDSNVTIICPNHGEFEQTPYQHLKTKHGCTYCGYEIARFKTLSGDEFLCRAIEKFCERFDYSKVEYKGVYEPVTIICHIHGEFKQTPDLHIRSSHGCQACARTSANDLNRTQPDKVIDDFFKMYGDLYDYSEMYYISGLDNIIIKCKLCKNRFETSPIKHLNGKGCEICKNNNFIETGTANFIEKAKLKFGDKFDYSLVEYKGATEKIRIICKKHGEFNQTPTVHITATSGCPKCGDESTANILSKSKDEVLKCFIKVHGDKFDYTKVNYINCKEKVLIKCNTCEYEFNVSPGHHQNGTGCPQCNCISTYSKTKFAKYSKDRYDGLINLYLIKCFNSIEEFYKIGVSLHNTNIRFKTPSKMPYQYEILKVYNYDVDKLLDLETLLHKSVKPYHYQPEISFGGSIKECFKCDKDTISRVIKYIDNLQESNFENTSDLSL